MEKCRYSGKNSYATEQAALIAACFSAGKYNTSKLKVYKCNWCHRWHLTSKVK